jgi:hypothetical protein
VSSGGIHPLAQLMRRFAVDWLDRAHESTCAEIMAPGYTATVGGVALEGRDEAYLPATLAQLHRFPGLLVTVHDLWLSDERAALRFTEHGASSERGGAPAAWAGIGIFDWDGVRLTANVTEEDYLSRRRQLAGGAPDPVAAPAVAPWTARPAAPDPDAEEAVRRWLATGDLTAGGGVQLDDAWTGQPTPVLVEQSELEIDTWFCAGRRVAFHLTQRGTYRGGIDLPDQPIGAPVGLRACGMVELDGGGGIGGHVIRDRVGLRRDLVQLTGAR